MSGGNGWIVTYDNPGPAPIVIRVFVECATLV
jgi:hypothetical protein